MTGREYAAIRAINWSTLKEMRRSPLHFRHRIENEREDTTAMKKGRAVHTLVFEPDRFPVEYAVFEGKARRGKAWEAFEEANQGRTILKVDEYEIALAMRDAVHRHPRAAEYLRQGRAEQTITWKDGATGLDCKARLDWICEPAVVDLKSCADAAAYRFGQAAARLGYHCQLAWYTQGLAAATGTEPKPAILIAVEQEPPHDVVVYRLGDDELYAGEQECRQLLQRVAECRRDNRWPGRADEEQVLQLPAWIWKDDDEDIDALGIKFGAENNDEEEAA